MGIFSTNQEEARRRDEKKLKGLEEARDRAGHQTASRANNQAFRDADRAYRDELRRQGK